jgi:hypothetical protein
MSGHDYTVEFRIFSDTIDPSEITRELNLKPCQTRVEGALGPGGRVLKGMWAFDGAEGSNNWESLEDGLNFVLDKLWPQRENIVKYKSSGRLVWWCGNFQSSVNGGLTLSAGLLARLGEFGAELFIDTYFSNSAEKQQGFAR